MALADMARKPDDPDKPSQCWPPMHGRDGAIGLCDWTCLSERAVQRSVKALVAAGLIARRQLSHGALYTVTLPLSPVPQSGDCQSGDPQSGDSQSVSPVPQSPKALPSAKVRKKASPSSLPRTGSPNPYPMPEGVDPDAWADFLVNRKRKHMANTVSAHKTLMDDLKRSTTEAWSIPRLLSYAAGRGWASVRNPDLEDNHHGKWASQSGGSGVARPGCDRKPEGFIAALREASARHGPDDLGGS